MKAYRGVGAFLTVREISALAPVVRAEPVKRLCLFAIMLIINQCRNIIWRSVKPGSDGIMQIGLRILEELGA